MSSPTKRYRRPIQAATTRLSEPSLPLHLSLAHILINLFPSMSTPIHGAEPQINPYSATFTDQILTLVAREVYEVLDEARTYRELSKEVDTLLNKEKAAIRRANEKIRARGGTVSQDMTKAEDQEDWMESFVRLNDCTRTNIDSSGFPLCVIG
jgi:anaphase-promoting complex subunit 5